MMFDSFAGCVFRSRFSLGPPAGNPDFHRRKGDARSCERPGVGCSCKINGNSVRYDWALGPISKGPSVSYPWESICSEITVIGDRGGSDMNTKERSVSDEGNGIVGRS